MQLRRQFGLAVLTWRFGASGSCRTGARCVGGLLPITSGASRAFVRGSSAGVSCTSAWRIAGRGGVAIGFCKFTGSAFIGSNVAIWLMLAGRLPPVSFLPSPRLWNAKYPATQTPARPIISAPCRRLMRGGAGVSS